jgi:hypothetical protein
MGHSQWRHIVPRTGPFDPHYNALNQFATFALESDSTTGFASSSSNSVLGGALQNEPVTFGGASNNLLAFSGPSQATYGAPSVGAQHRPPHPYADPEFNLNQLSPSDPREYGGWSGQFDTLAKARNYLRRVRWTPPQGPVPQTDEQRVRYVQALYEAFTNYTGFFDNTKSQNKVNRLIEQKYPQQFIEARCVEIVEEMVRLHTDGAGCLETEDPTVELKGPQHRKGFFSASSKASGQRKLSFDARFQQLCRTVMVRSTPIIIMELM